MKIKFGKWYEWLPKVAVGVANKLPLWKVAASTVKIEDKGQVTDLPTLTREKLLQLIDGLIVAYDQLDADYEAIYAKLDEYIIQADAAGIDPKIISRLYHAREVATEYPFLVRVRLVNIAREMERGIL